jgi:hypothetical protein
MRLAVTFAEPPLVHDHTDKGASLTQQSSKKITAYPKVTVLLLQQRERTMVHGFHS